jgi:phosphatidylglycerol lysyltransferase
MLKKEMKAPMRIKHLYMGFTSKNPLRHGVRSLIALFTGLVGLGDMLTSLFPRFHWDMSQYIWPVVSHAQRLHAQSLTVVIGFFLIMLSYGLARGKRHAWFITLLLSLLSASLLPTMRSHTILVTVGALLVVILLAIFAPFFQAKSDPPSALRGYVALLLGLGIVISYAFSGLLAFYNDFDALIDRFGIEGLIPRLLVSAHLHLPHNTPVEFFSDALPLLCVSAVIYGMIQLFRPVAAVLLPDTEERRKVVEMTHLYGKNSISYFALDTDKSYFFSSSGKAVLSYVLQGSTAVVAGDPIGPDSEMTIILREFMTFCQQQDWTIVFWQIRAELMSLYRSAGLHLLKIGEDAIIHAASFTLKGGAMANVRTSAKRAEKEGLGVVFYHGQVTDYEQLAQMESISRYWLTSKGGSEMGFSMGHFDPQGDPEQLYALAVDQHNKVHAFVSFVPIYGRNGWGLDLMRRAELAAPGTMELLLARSIEYMKSRGMETVSLGLAPLSDINKEDETFLGSSIDFLSNRFGNPDKNRSLCNFKKKFQPGWESRYLVYSDALSLPKIGIALYQAHQRDTRLLTAVRQSLSAWQNNRRQAGAGATAKAEAAKA